MGESLYLCRMDYLSYAFSLRPVIKSWYKGKVYTSDYKDYKRCVYSVSNCVVEHGLYVPNLRKYKHKIFLDITISEYYMFMRSGKWCKMTKPTSASIRRANETIRVMI